MQISVLDVLSPVESAKQALTTPAGMAVLAAVIIVLIAALVVIVIKARKKSVIKSGSVLSENIPPEDKKAP